MTEIKNFIFIRGLRYVDPTVFCVGETGQKTYKHPISYKELAYSSGQQVKRSVLDEFRNQLGISQTGSWIVKKLNGKDKPTDHMAYQSPTAFNLDVLVGGYMRPPISDGNKKGKEFTNMVTRRSPLSISSFHPLHYNLVTVYKENIIVYDRRGDKNSEIKIIDKDNKFLSVEEANKLVEEFNLSKLHFVNAKDAKRTLGFFKYDICIDLRRLFSVCIDGSDSEIEKSIQDKLKSEGWIEGVNEFGKCLILPESERNPAIESLASSLINWRITSNQSLNFSPQSTMALAVSQDASKIDDSIFGKLIELEDSEIIKAEPFINVNSINDDLKIFIKDSAKSCIRGISQHTDCNAMNNAKSHLIEMMKNYEYVR